MSNEDMLEIAERLLRTRSTDALALVQTVEALAAAVRELRKDRERLDWLERNLYVASDIVPGGTPDELGWREAIDAAMGERSD